MIGELGIRVRIKATSEFSEQNIAAPGWGGLHEQVRESALENWRKSVMIYFTPYEEHNPIITQGSLTISKEEADRRGLTVGDIITLKLSP